MSETPNTSYEEPINNDSFNNQNEGLNQEKSSTPSVEDYISEQKSLLSKITNVELHKQAQEELDEVRLQFDKLKGDTSEIASLKLADLREEFERDIEGMKVLQDTHISALLPVDEMITHINGLGEQEEEKIYSILSNTSKESLLEFLELYNEEEGDSKDSEDISYFLKKLSLEFSGNIESDEVKEIIGINIDSLDNIDEIDFYISKIDDLQSYTDENNDRKLRDIKPKLEGRKTFLEDLKKSQNKSLESQNKSLELKKINDKIDSALNFTKVYTDLNKELPVNIKNKYSKVADILNQISDFENITKDNLTRNPDLLKKLTENKNALLGVLLEPSFENPTKTVAEQILMDLGKDNPKMYSTTLDTFRRLSPVLSQQLQDLPDPYTEVDFDISNISATKSLTIGAAIDLNDPDTKVEGHMVTNGMKSVDTSEFPPQSYIGLENGFRFNTTIDFPEELYDKRVDYIKERRNIQNDINLIDYKISIHDKYQELIKNPEENKTLIDLAKSQFPGIENWTSVGLEEDKNKKQEDLDKVVKIYETELKVYLLDYKEKVREQDEKAKKSLDFIERIGLSILPQSTINQLFAELKNGSLKIDGLDIDPKKIDLKNARFGESDMEANGTKWQENLVKLYNKMISGNTGEPLELTQFIGEMAGRVDPTYFKEKLETAGVINDLGEPQLTKMRNNLRRENNLDKPEETAEK